MKQSIIKVAVLGALGLVSAQAFATGLVSIPHTGFAVGSNTSPYRLCNTTGNFGSVEDDDPNETEVPTAGANNDCAVFPASTSTSPVSGYSLVASNTTNLNFSDPTLTGGATVKVGTLRTYLWRNTSTNMCITGARATSLTSNDIDITTSGIQTFEINDVSIGGFAAYNGSSAVNAGYYTSSASGESVAYRIGRTFTAVQHRADPTDATGNTVASGYVSLPLTASAPAASTSINGLATPWVAPLAVPTAAQQGAALSTNWVTFTTDANAEDPDGSSTSDGTALFYVEASCPSGTYTTTRVNDIIRFKQTGQENPNLLEIKAPGYVMGTGASATTY